MSIGNVQKIGSSQILVVDDTPANLKLLTDILTNNGYQVRPATGGKMALRSLAAEIPDLILLDIKMPEMDGYEVCAQLKANPETKNIPVIFISALDEMADKVKGFTVGGIDFITKPFQAEEVLIRVETHISVHRLSRELEIQNSRMQREIEERKKVESELIVHKTKLEELVALRTNDLNTSYLKLQQELQEKEALEKELMLALDKSEESDRLKSSLLSNMNHEFRTPITGILGMSSVLKEMTKDPKVLHMLDCIVDSGRRLMRTLNAILEFAQVEANIFSKNFKDINVNRIAESVSLEVLERVTSHGIEFNLQLPDNSLFVYSNEKIISQVMLNLLDNSIKFTDKGIISMRISEEMIENVKYAQIIISDTGIGIAPEHIEIIFDEFRQVSEGLSRSYEGVGLGLTLVKKLVDLMNGNIRVESELGKGSSFIISIPAVRISTEKVQKVDEKSVVKKQSELEKPAEEPVILLVEDNVINIEVIDVFLMGICKVDYVRTGSEALDKVKERQYPLIFMDINLGVGMDGVETAREIRKIGKYDKTPIVALTGYAMDSDKDKFLSAGFSHYLAKPFDKKDIISLVEQIFVDEGLYK